MKKERKMTTLSYNLILFRKRAMLTQAQVASAIGVKRPTYAYYELGTAPKVDILRRLASLYRINVGELLGNDSEIPINQIPEVGEIDVYSGNNFIQTFNELKDDEKAVVLAFRTISPENRKLFAGEFEQLIEKYAE